MTLELPPDRSDPGKILDSQAERLASRHEARLIAMTQAAVADVRGGKHSIVWQPWIFSAAAFLFSVVLVAVLVWVKPAEPPVAATVAQQAPLIPDWVNDDDVPVSLLENMDLYVWISRYPTEALQG